MPSNSPQNSLQEEKETNVADFRAPPPSPIGSSRRASSVANDEVLTEFLEHSLRVPDLILPDRIFPRQKPVRDILTVDFQALNLNNGCDLIVKIKDSLSEIGCFQVVNHGVPSKLMGRAVRRASRIFRMSPEKKKMAVRSPEIGFGFEEVCGDQEEVVSEMGEEFVWGKSHDFKLKMEGILGVKFSKFSEKMETLAAAIEKVAKDIVLILNDENFTPNIPNGERHDDDDGGGGGRDGCVCHIYKHPQDVAADQCISALRYDVIRMMIKGSDYSHALAFHICEGSSEFHVYSKKGWISFIPFPNSFIVTAGDLIQAWSGGRYKHVIGKPIYTSKNEECTSLSFLCSPNLNPKHTYRRRNNNNEVDKQDEEKQEKRISIRQQALIAIILTIACQFLIHIYTTKLSHP